MASSLVLFFFFIFLARVGDGVDASSSTATFRVLCPLKTGFTQFVRWSGSPDNPAFSGFAIEVFKHAMQARLPVNTSFLFFGYGDGNKTFPYDNMIDELVKKEYDAVIGDLTITIERMQKVDFTQPYTQSALLVVVPSVYSTSASAWDFLHPFSWQLWLSIFATFLGTGFVIFILEKDRSPEFQEGPLKRRISNIFWFTSSMIFFSHREGIRTDFGRLVTFSWLLLVLVFTSSYTANLSSILTQVRLSTKIQGFESLKKMDVPVGYQEGSFTYDYLKRLGIQSNRLKALATESAFADALRKGPANGGVAAIVDEIPYVDSFLASNCDFTTVGPNIAYFGGLGFAFQKNSSLTREVSMSILSMAKNGTLQRLQNGWIEVDKCTRRRMANHLRLKSFAGLFYVIIILYTICVLFRAGGILWFAFFSGLLHALQRIPIIWAFLFMPQYKHAQVNPRISSTNTELTSTN